MMNYASLQSGGDRIEEPAGRFFIFCTFAASYLLNLAVTSFEELWLPDFLALTIIYWCVHQPQSVGMLIAFLCGLLMDVAHGSVLGQQSLAYVTIAYLSILLHRRIPWFGPVGQALHVLPLLLVAQILVMLVRLWFDGLWPGWIWFLQSATGALIWPVWSMLLSVRRRGSGSGDA